MASICSLLTYGSETWCLSDAVCRQLNGANSTMLVRITGRTYRQEANPRTTSFDLVKHIRARRLRWFGHILREESERRKEKMPSRIVFNAIREQYQLGKHDNLTMDAPDGQSVYSWTPYTPERPLIRELHLDKLPPRFKCRKINLTLPSSDFPDLSRTLTQLKRSR